MTLTPRVNDATKLPELESDMKRIWTKLRIVSLLFSGVIGATTANAATTIATYTGTIVGGSDNRGLFGLPGSLVGKPVTVTYTFDPSLGVYYNKPSRNDNRGNNFTGNSPILGVDIIVDGAKYSFDNSQGFIGQIIQGDISGGIKYDQVAHSAQSYRCVNSCDPNLNFGDDVINSFGQSNVNDFVNGLDMSAFLDYTFTPEDNGGGFFQLGKTDYSTTNYDFYATADFKFSRVNIVQLSSAVPEPSTWMMVIIGFGLIGTAMRHKRKRLAQMRLS